jgi:hypothetical protein
MKVIMDGVDVLRKVLKIRAVLQAQLEYAALCPCLANQTCLPVRALCH